MKPHPQLDWDRVGQSYPDTDLILFRARFDAMRHPQSRAVMQRLVLESPDWVNMVAFDAAGRCVMVRQYRFGVGYATLETPGGMVDGGEDSREAAERELLEETGYAGGEWRYLGAVEPNPAIHDHLCHHWLAERVERVRDPTPGSGELIAVDLLSPGAVFAAVHSGELRHALALSALSRVFDFWGGRRPAAGLGS